MKIKFTDQSTGRPALLEPSGAYLDAQPLNFTALCALETNSTRTEIHINNPIIYREADPPKLEAGVVLGIDWDQPVRVYTLLVGGWLPPLLSRGRFLYPDRNILTHATKDVQTPFGWHSRAINEASDVRGVDPLFCAVEGKDSRTPSFLEFRAELTRASRRLAQVWPNAKVWTRTLAEKKQIYKLIVGAKMESKRDLLAFLLDAQKLIPAKPSPKKHVELTNQLFQLASKHRVTACSITFATVLSLIYANDTQPAFAAKVLKFYVDDYSPELAYNALADIVSLELLQTLYRMTNDDYSLLTGDRWLAMLWCALDFQIKSPSAQGGQVLGFRLSAELLPALPLPERQDLLRRCLSCQSKPRP